MKKQLVENILINFILNDTLIHSDIHPGTTVLDFVKYHQRLPGTKIGCREGDCGACTVLVGTEYEGKVQYQTMCSCLMALGNANGKHIVTVEAVNMAELSPVQQALT